MIGRESKLKNPLENSFSKSFQTLNKNEKEQTQSLIKEADSNEEKGSSSNSNTEIYI